MKSLDIPNELEELEDIQLFDTLSDDEIEKSHSNFLHQIASLEGSKRFLHDKDTQGLSGESLVYDGPLSELSGQKLTVESLLEPILDNNLKKSLKKNIKNGLEKQEHLKLKAPLSTPEEERSIRSSNYARAQEDLSKWDAVVHSRRSAPQLSFPLLKPNVHLMSASEHSHNFKAQTPLEKEVMNLLRVSKAVPQPGEELSENERNLMDGMTLKEAEEKRRELHKFKILQAREETKIRRQNKIKSKKYRKILRKEKERKKEVDSEKMDPLTRVESLEKARILERASLKHRNASKYLQFLGKQRTQMSKESQILLQEQLRKHRELTSKASLPPSEISFNDLENEESQNEQKDEDENEDSTKIPTHSSNPWMNNSNFHSFNKDVKKYFTTEKLQKSQTIDDLFSEAETLLKKNNNGSLIKTKKENYKKEKDEEEETLKEENSILNHQESLNFQTDRNHKPEMTKAPKIDPSVFIVPKKKARQITRILSASNDKSDDDEDEDDSETRKLISEAFAEDDVASEFVAEKKEIISRNRGQKIDLSLPGWGQWGGKNIHPSKRKRIFVKAPLIPKRKDSNQGHLILNEDKNDKIRSHQISSVPFPFRSVKDFEASIRTPIGETFVPRTVFKKFIEPPVKTLIGRLIEPMTTNQLVQRRLIQDVI